jgi:hypothetical protein
MMTVIPNLEELIQEKDYQQIVGETDRLLLVSNAPDYQLQALSGELLACRDEVVQRLGRCLDRIGKRPDRSQARNDASNALHGVLQQSSEEHGDHQQRRP